MAINYIYKDTTFNDWRMFDNAMSYDIGDISQKKLSSTRDSTQNELEWLETHQTVTGVSLSISSGLSVITVTKANGGHKLRPGMRVSATIDGLIISSEKMSIISITYTSENAEITLSDTLTFAPSPNTVLFNFYVNILSHLNDLEYMKVDRHGDTIRGDLIIDGNAAASTTGLLGTNETTFNLIDTNATTVNAFGDSTTINLGNATSATLTCRPGTIVGSNTTQNIFNTVATTVNAFGAATSVIIGADSNTALTTIRSDLKVNGNDLLTDELSFNLLNATATTINAFGAATTVNLSASSGTTTIKNNLDVDLDINVDGGDLTTNQTSFNLINTNATTVNLGGAATSLNLGASSGNTTVNNDLIVTGGDITISGSPNVTASTTGNAATLYSTTTGSITIGSTTGTTNIRQATINMSNGATGVVNIDSTKANTLGSIDGAFVVNGGTYVAGNATVGADLRIKGGDIGLEGVSTIRNVIATNAASLFDTNTSGTITIGNNTTGTTINARTETVNLGYAVATGVVNIDSTKANTLGSTDGALVVDGGAYVAGNVTLGSDLRIKGGDIGLEGVAPTIVAVTTTSPVSVFNTTDATITIGGSSGSTVFQGDVSVNTGKSFTANGNATFNANTIIGSDSSDTLTTNATSTFNGTATFNANTVIGSDSSDTLTTNSTATPNAPATFNGTATFNANTIIGSDSSDTLTINSVLTSNSTATLLGAVNITGANVSTVISPTGTGVVAIAPTTLGSINNMSVGATTRSTGAFTTLTANGASTLTANVNSTSTTTGTLVVTGGVGMSGNLYVGGLASLGNNNIATSWTNLGSVATVDINGGTIDGITQASGTINGPIAVGGTWTAAATWTLPAHTLGGTVNLNNSSFSGTCANGGTFTTIDINGGTIDGTTVGSTSASTVNSTKLSICSNATTSIAEFVSYNVVVATTSSSNLFVFDKSVYRSAEVTIQATRGSSYFVTKFLMSHDGTDTFETEFGSLGNQMGTFDTDLLGSVGSEWRMRVTQDVATSTTYKILVTAIRV